MNKIEELLAIICSLRDKENGCQWDLQQTHASLARFVIEEAYEVEEAIERSDPMALCSELGDLLFQVVFHARLAEEQQHFDFTDVVNAISEKLRRRHPQIFDVDARLHDRQSTLQAHHGEWETVKREEREARASLGVLDDIAGTLPAVTRSMKLQKRAASVGFDWKSISPVFDKVIEELEEVRAEVLAADQQAIEDEVGDLLFAVVNLARHADVDPESALRRANRKFEGRFRNVERVVLQQKLVLSSLTQAQLEAIWAQVKREQ
ncbi:MAG: nucleoside triphosphate pyrophosphohydrolase [Thiohalomonadales bacterium]